MKLSQLLLLLSMAVTTVAVADINPARARFNYQMFCQGCHLPDGVGVNDVPQLKGVVGLFLKTDAGREYLVRVPGVAASMLDDVQLTEVMNWMLPEFAGDSMTADFEPYTVTGLSALRRNPLNEVQTHRAQLLTEIATQRIQQLPTP